MARAFRIVGTVDAETIYDALRAVAAYIDPDNKDHDGHEGESEPVHAIRFEWREVDEDAELGDSYDSRAVARLLDAARRT